MDITINLTDKEIEFISLIGIAAPLTSRTNVTVEEDEFKNGVSIGCKVNENIKKNDYGHIMIDITKTERKKLLNERKLEKEINNYNIDKLTIYA